MLCVSADACDISGLLLPECKVTQAPSAYEALKHHNATPFDLYLLDYWLQDFTGPRLCRDLRRDDPHVPIVLCSSTSGDGEQRRGIAAGATAYLCKPIEPTALTRNVRALLELSYHDNRLLANALCDSAGAALKDQVHIVD